MAALQTNIRRPCSITPRCQTLLHFFLNALQLIKLPLVTWHTWSSWFMAQTLITLPVLSNLSDLSWEIWRTWHLQNASLSAGEVIVGNDLHRGYGFMTEGSQLTKSCAPLSCDNTMVNLDALLAHSKRRLYTTYRNTDRTQTSASFFKVTSFGPTISHLFRAEGTSIWRIKRSLWRSWWMKPVFLFNAKLQS